MKIHVIYDNQGKIVSAGVPLPQTYDFRAPAFGPKGGEGQYAAELDVPEEHIGLGLTDLVQRLRVEIKGKQHRLVSKGE